MNEKQIEAGEKILTKEEKICRGVKQLILNWKLDEKKNVESVKKFQLEKLTREILIGRWKEKHRSA